MKWVHILAIILLIIGGLNWGLVGLFNFNLVTSLLGYSPALEKFIYILVGLSALYVAFTHKSDCKTCAK